MSSALRRFYLPDPPYNWSFLRPVTNVSLASGMGSLQLPDDFGGIDGIITIQSAVTQVTWPLTTTSEGTIRNAYEITPNTTGRPIMCALRAIRGTSAIAGQRFELLMYPLADMDYTVVLPYYVNAEALTIANPWPLGGMAHAETILAACKSQAEMALDDVAAGQGPWSIEFAARLRASINADRRFLPQKVGYMQDSSDCNGGWNVGWWHTYGRIAVNGIIPPSYGPS